MKLTFVLGPSPVRTREITLYKQVLKASRSATWEVWGPPAPGDAMWPPGASWQVAMPQVGLTWGWLAGGDVRGEPHPPPCLGYFIVYMSKISRLRK